MNYKLRKLKISSIDALNSLKHGYKVNLRSDKDNFDKVIELSKTI